MNEELQKSLIAKINKAVGRDIKEFVDGYDTDVLERFVNVMNRPNIRVRLNTSRAPFGVTLNTPYGSIMLDERLNTEGMYINGTRFTVNDPTIDGIEQLVGNVDSAKRVLGNPTGRQKRGRRVRTRRSTRDEVPFETIQARALEEIELAGITYDNLFDELGGLMADSTVTAHDLADELYSNQVDEKDIARFLVYESRFANDVISKAYNLPLGSAEPDYNFETIQADDSFIGRLMTNLGATEAGYDAEKGALNIDGRIIHNLPTVDEKGVFSNGNTRYLPYHIGYFVEGEGSRVERLRTIDPVQVALDSVKLQYDLTNGDIKFQTILDVTRNLVDFDQHPYGDEILDTLKRKVVLDKSLLTTNSLYDEYNGNADELGAVALMMLDDDARGVIDPLGTSNGGNMGVIFYLTEDAEFLPDGSIKRGESQYSQLGNIMKDFHVEGDNFNRNQMSFNAALTSSDVRIVNVAYTELAGFNAEDALVATKAGAEMYTGDAEHEKAKAVGDKMEDFHGNKGVISMVIDPDMDMDEASEQQINNLVQLAKDNPDLHFVASPVSMSSRMNMGVMKEALSGQKKDLVLPNGEVVKDGIVQMAYMSLPQTAEHKSKDYSQDSGARKYSSLFRYALSSKIGDELYNKTFINDDVRDAHVDEIATVFQRLGVSFENENAGMFKRGNVYDSVSAPVSISVDDLALMTPAVMRNELMNKMENGQINILLNDSSITSPMTEKPMQDEFGRNILPIRVTEGKGIPFRYNELFKELALNNVTNYQTAYNHAVGNDFSQVTRKNNLLKNINTMAFEDGAHTDVIVPDPRLGLNQVRSTLSDDIIIAHRDPAIKSGNALVFENIAGGSDNVMHISPWIMVMQDGDFDGDTEGVKDTLHLSDEDREMLYLLANPTENLNHYGEVNLSLGGHFKAMAVATGEDISDITFENGETNAHVARLVEDHVHNMLKNPNAYGAYAVSFTNDKVALDTIGKLADDGIKGNREEMQHRFNHGYTDDENRAVMKALIAKSEWTGLAGAITNNVIAAMGDREFDPELVRVTFDITHTMTQSVLQMKKNADKLGEIDNSIKEVKKVMAGKYDPEESRTVLKDVTKGLIPEQAVDQFVDMVVDRQANLPFRTSASKFGDGVLNSTSMTTTKLAYVNGANFSKAVGKLIEDGQKYKSKSASEQAAFEDEFVIEDIEELNSGLSL